MNVWNVRNEIVSVSESWCLFMIVIIYCCWSWIYILEYLIIIIKFVLVYICYRYRNSIYGLLCLKLRRCNSLYVGHRCRKFGSMLRIMFCDFWIGPEIYFGHYIWKLIQFDDYWTRIYFILLCHKLSIMEDYMWLFCNHRCWFDSSWAIYSS